MRPSLVLLYAFPSLLIKGLIFHFIPIHLPVV